MSEEYGVELQDATATRDTPAATTVSLEDALADDKVVQHQHIPSFHISPDNILSDRLAISRAAKAIDALWTEKNTPSLYIKVGLQFAMLHDVLAKNSKHDVNRIGWCRAFEDPQENKFRGMKRRQADDFIAIYEAFSHLGTVVPTWKLPHNLRPLRYLARLMLKKKQPFTDALLKKCIADGSVGPTSIESDIRNVAKSFDLVAADHGGDQSGSSLQGNSTSMEMVLGVVQSFLSRASPEEQRQFYSVLVPDTPALLNIFDMLPMELKNALSDRLAGQKLSLVKKRSPRKRVGRLTRKDMLIPLYTTGP